MKDHFKDIGIQVNYENISTSEHDSDRSIPETKSYTKEVIDSHMKAAEKLDALSQYIEEKSPQELNKVYNQIHLIKQNMSDLPDFSTAILYAIDKYAEENISISDKKIKTFMLIQLLEDIYDEKPITKFYTQEHLEEDFKKVITDLTSDISSVDVDLQGEITSIYLD